MMVDVEAVIERLEALDAYIAELEHFAGYSLKSLSDDFVKYRAVQRSLQLAAQAVIDIATHVIAADFDHRVQDYRQALIALGSVGVLTPEFAERLAPLAGFRNILVHEYLAVDPEKLYSALTDSLDDLRVFGQQIALYIQQSGSQ
ncbi:MAG: DUF86 domain-containing protein [Chloroflexi bacterium]|nr:DUF86 domain-containing protein [Chloroflexota bacterium]